MFVILADQARHMKGGSDDVMEVMERDIPLDGSACSGSRTCERSSSNMHRVGVLCGEEVVRSRVGAAPRCVLMEADVDTGLFWCAVSHVFEFAPTTRGRREFEAGVCPVRDPLEHQKRVVRGVLPVAGPEFTRKRCRVRRRASCAGAAQAANGRGRSCSAIADVLVLVEAAGEARFREGAARSDQEGVSGRATFLAPSHTER
jgi:hypothetical protein